MKSKGIGAGTALGIGVGVVIVVTIVAILLLSFTAPKGTLIVRVNLKPWFTTSQEYSIYIDGELKKSDLLPVGETCESTFNVSAGTHTVTVMRGVGAFSLSENTFVPNGGSATLEFTLS